MKLNEIAQKMIEFATQHPYKIGDDLTPYLAELPRGLVVTYTSNRLSLSRKNVFPNQVEVDICRLAFGVPDYATVTEASAGDGLRHIVLEWAAQKPYLTVIYPAAPWLALPAGRWRKLANGKIEVSYLDFEEMQWCVLASIEAKRVETSRGDAPRQASINV